MRELILPPYPFALDSPQTHCVPSLVCSKTPCFCCETPCISPHSIAFYSPSNLFAFDSPQTHCILHSFALKLPAFPVLQYSLCLIRPQRPNLSIHSPLKIPEPWCFAHWCKLLASLRLQEGRGGQRRPRYWVLGLTVGLGGWLVWVS